MKKLIFLSIPLIFLSCSTLIKKELSIEEKNTIRDEVSVIMNDLIRNGENLDLEQSMMPYHNHSEFLSLSNGYFSDYNAFKQANEQYYPALESQRFFDSEFSFTFINKEAVILSWKCSSEVRMKDGTGYTVNPYAVSITFKKIDNQWKIIHGHGSGSVLALANN